MNEQMLFSQWVQAKATTAHAHNCAVIYTRVSSKEQAMTNLSLHFQKQAITEYSEKFDFQILGEFGGTYESATNDGRKEFVRMLAFIEENKGKVSHILVYTLDRFSRTGGGAIKLSMDLREKFGVTVLAVTQPTDTSNPSGVFLQNIMFLFSEFDNQLRRQRIIAGLKAKLEKGIWCLRLPLGYDSVVINGTRSLRINKEGRKIRDAFNLKRRGVCEKEICAYLKAFGIKCGRAKLRRLLSNPFYCGVLVSRLLDGKVVIGVHPPLVSMKSFLKLNQAA